MWIWQSETRSLRCPLPQVSVQVIRVGDRLLASLTRLPGGNPDRVLTGSGSSKSAPRPQTLGQLLNWLENWLVQHQATAAGVIGFESRVYLNQPLHWLAQPLHLNHCGLELVLAIQLGVPQVAGSTSLGAWSDRHHAEPPLLVLDQEVRERVRQRVERGLALRQRLKSDHLVVAADFQLQIPGSLLPNWLKAREQSGFQGFFLQFPGWELASCTPEPYLSIDPQRLRVQLLAGTFRSGEVWDQGHLRHEHRAARTALKAMIAGVYGGRSLSPLEIRLAVSEDVVAFGPICHLRSIFELPYQASSPMLRQLVTLTPSQATGSLTPAVWRAVRQLEGRPRGYYGGCFFLRTPERLESLISIRSIWRSRTTQTGEILAGAGLTQKSTVAGETAEILLKAATCARLLGARVEQPVMVGETSSWPFG